MKQECSDLRLPGSRAFLSSIQTENHKVTEGCFAITAHSGAVFALRKQYSVGVYWPVFLWCFPNSSKTDGLYFHLRRRMITLEENMEQSFPCCFFFLCVIGYIQDRGERRLDSGILFLHISIDNIKFSQK